MKPYYVLSVAGPVDATGAPKKFGLLGADDPTEAEKLAIQVAEAHANRGDVCSVAVLQLYRSYPAQVLSDLLHYQQEALRLQDVAKNLEEDKHDLNRQLQTLRLQIKKAKPKKRRRSRK